MTAREANARRRGHTLIELMVALAIVGIAATGVAGAVVAQQAEANDAILHERALGVLEHEADAVIRGVPADAADRARLLAALPGGRLDTRTPDAATVVLTVTWRSATGRPGRLELPLLRRAP